MTKRHQIIFAIVNIIIGVFVLSLFSMDEGVVTAIFLVIVGAACIGTGLYVGFQALVKKS